MKIMIKRVFSLILATLMTMMVGCDYNGSLNSKKSKEKWKVFCELPKDEKVLKEKADIEYLCDTLEKKRKDLYHDISKEDFQAKKNELISKLPRIDNDVEFYFELNRLIANLGEAHTTLGSLEDLILNQMNFYNFDVNKFDEGWILTGISKDNGKYLGEKVVEINGVKIEEIYDRIINLCSHENSYGLINTFDVYVGCSEILKMVGIINDTNEPIILKLEDKTGIYTDISVKISDVNAIASESSMLRNLVTTPKTSYDKTQKYWFDTIDENTLFIQYNSCREDAELPINEFVKQISDEIKNKRFKKVIFDVRYNGGGDQYLIYPLFKELKILKQKYNFKVYTLIGNKTFSSGMDNAYESKKELSAVLLGQPTGGAPNHYGDKEEFVLPNTGFTVAYATKYVKLIKENSEEALFPDIEVKHMIKDYMQGSDPEVEAVIKDEN